MKKFYVCFLVYLLTLSCSLALTEGKAYMPARELPEAFYRTAKTEASSSVPEPSAAAAIAPNHAKNNANSFQLDLPCAISINAPNKLSANMPDVSFLPDYASIQSTRYMENDYYIFVKTDAALAVNKYTGQITKEAPDYYAAEGGNLFYSETEPDKGRSVIYRVNPNTQTKTVLNTEQCGVRELFAYKNSLYYALENDPNNTLYRENFDGSKREAFLQGTGSTVIYRDKAYSNEANIIHETDTETKNETRQFCVAGMPDGCSLQPLFAAYGKLFVNYRGPGVSQMAVMDITSGKAEAEFERCISSAAYGQYVFYITDSGKWFALNAYDSRNGKCYYASDLTDLNASALNYAQSGFVLYGVFSTGKCLYICTAAQKNLFLYRVAIAGGKAKVSLVTGQKLSA